MPLNPTLLAQQLEAAEVTANGVLPPDAAAKIRLKCQAQAAAFHAFILAGDVGTVTTATGAGVGANSGGPIATTVNTAGSGAGKLT